MLYDIVVEYCVVRHCCRTSWGFPFLETLHHRRCIKSNDVNSSFYVIITQIYITQMAFNHIYIYILDLYKIYCGFLLVRYDLLYIISNLIELTGNCCCLALLGNTSTLTTRSELKEYNISHT